MKLLLYRALKVDTVAWALGSDRIMPECKNNHIKLDLPKISAPKDVIDAHDYLMNKNFNYSFAICF